MDNENIYSATTESDATKASEEAGVAKIDTATISAEQPTPSLEQLTLEVKFYLGQIGQNIIEVGKRLIAAKEMLPHGEWQNWLKDNFNLKERMAQRFMQCAERFGKASTSTLLNQSQMVELLALPEAESESFIEAKAAEGNPVEDMTVKKLREEIKQWKAKSEEADKKIAIYAEELSATQINLDDAQKERDAIARERDNIKQVNSELRAERDAANRAKFAATEKLRAQQFSTVVKVPDDYESIKQENERLRKSLAERPIEVEVPADYHTNKLALASAQKELDDAQASLRNEIVAFQRIKRQLGETEDELQRRINEEHDANHHATIFHKLDVLDQILAEVATAKDIAKILADYKETQSMHYNSLRYGMKGFAQRISDLEGA